METSSKVSLGNVLSLIGLISLVEISGSLTAGDACGDGLGSLLPPRWRRICFLGVSNNCLSFDDFVFPSSVSCCGLGDSIITVVVFFFKIISLDG